jgi:hypothetical protein
MMALSSMSSTDFLKNMMLQQRIDQLLIQINTNRIFMNMVIHDMRNPTGAIEFGVKQSLDNLQVWKEKIKMLKKAFRKYMDLDRSQSLSLGSGHSES